MKKYLSVIVLFLILAMGCGGESPLHVDQPTPPYHPAGPYHPFDPDTPADQAVDLPDYCYYLDRHYPTEDCSICHPGW